MPKTRSSSPKRDIFGRFPKTCGSIIHDNLDVGTPQSPLYNKETSKKLKRSTKHYLEENDILPKKSKYICKSCVDKIEEKDSRDCYPQKPCSSLQKCDGFESEEQISEKNDDKYDSSLQTAQYLYPLIKSDISRLYNDKDKCCLSNLLGYNPEDWLSQRPKALVGLLRQLCGYNEYMNDEESKKVAKCIELIYGCHNSKLVLPLSFQENLLVYSLCRSKQLVSYNSQMSPSGSSDFISKWLNEQSSTPVDFPEGLVRSVFDNEQVIGKTHKVKADNKVPASVITSHIYISLDNENKLQNDALYAPSSWLFTDGTNEKKAEFSCLPANSFPELFRGTRNSFIESRLLSVVNEQKENESDFIDDLLNKKSTVHQEKICLNCGAENESSMRKCTNCKGSVVREDINISDFYSHTQKQFPYHNFSNIEVIENNFKVKTGEPDMVNPSSFENISQILFNMAERAGIQTEEAARKWLFLECDGGIYYLVEKLVFNVLHCDACDGSFFGKDVFFEHKCSILYDIPPKYEFGWLLPLPGLLHIEMNACKAFFDLNWEIMLQDVCAILGFSSPKAQEYARRCSDHHKSWKILEILYLAITDELLLPYVRYCLKNTISPSASGYWQWADDICNPNYMYLQQMALTFLHSLMLFRVGCRYGNADAIISGRDKLSLLFYARNHTRYQRIMAINQLIEFKMPQKVKDIVFSSMTLSRIGNTGHYQGGDACLEEVNKEAKAWISPIGVPSDRDWLKVFRNLDKLNELKTNMLDHRTKPNPRTRAITQPFVDSSEVVPVRELLRKQQYLSFPMENQEHVSVNKKVVLSESLHNFTAEAEIRRLRYYEALVNDEIHQIDKVHITKDECEQMSSIEKKTMVDIQRMIYLKIEELPDGQLQEDLFNKTVKGKKNKAAYIEFYKSLSDED